MQRLVPISRHSCFDLQALCPQGAQLQVALAWRCRAPFGYPCVRNTESIVYADIRTNLVHIPAQVIDHDVHGIFSNSVFWACGLKGTTRELCT